MERDARCEWAWHDGERFHVCQLPPKHRGLHSRTDGTIPDPEDLPA